MAWNALVVIITACVTLLMLREGVRRTLLRELDQVLHEDIREIELALNEQEDTATLTEQLDRKDAGHAQHNWFAQLVDAQGGNLYRSKHAPPDDVWHLQKSGRAETVAEWRLLSKHLPMRKETVRVGASLEMLHADIARLDRNVLISAAFVLIVAPLAGFWLAGRATRPLAKIISTTARLRPSQLNERLEIRGTGDELDRLSETFNRLLDRIGNYLQDKRDFLANAAHELRTPLAAIHSSIEVALAGGRTNEEYTELLTEIIEELGRLEVLVNQLLLLSETETERLKVEKTHVRLDQLVLRSLDMFEGVAEHHGIKLVHLSFPSVTVEGNQQHLRQVIYNLVDNALKFTPAGGTVTVTINVDETTRTAVLAVSDTGPGIPANELPHVFDRFFRRDRVRSDVAETPQRSTGLGLSICQSIVRAHDGEIAVESELNRGSRFIVCLPHVDTENGTVSHSLIHSMVGNTRT
ncbi:MAG: ATP-binding protein [Pirellulaceae bacterium]|nr:HAMP domain-containing protein [Planctomycetales bacterium]